MPERIFKPFDTKTLLSKRMELAEIFADASGSTNAIRNSSTGFLKETGNVSQEQIKQKLMLCRYEVYLRGKGVDGHPPNDDCALLEAKDPFQEKTMRVVSSFQKWPGISTLGNQF